MHSNIEEVSVRLTIALRRFYDGYKKYGRGRRLGQYFAEAYLLRGETIFLETGEDIFYAVDEELVKVRIQECIHNWQLFIGC